MPSKVGDEITYLFPNVNGATSEGLEWKYFHLTFYNECNYLSMLRSKWNRVNKGGPR